MIISATKKDKTPAAISIIRDIAGNLKLISELSKNDLKNGLQIRTLEFCGHL